jgi:hypothetical protein
MAAKEQRKLAAAAMAAGVVVLGISASICRAVKLGRPNRVMSAYPHLAGDFAL